MINPSIKLFIDCADPAKIIQYAADERVRGFTTNPTLVRRSGATDYTTWALEAVSAAAGKPISLEVLSDSFDGMLYQAAALAEMGSNVYVKIPITNTRGQS